MSNPTDHFVTVKAPAPKGTIPVFRAPLDVEGMPPGQPGQVLTVDPTAEYGLSYQTPTASANPATDEDIAELIRNVREVHNATPEEGVATVDMSHHLNVIADPITEITFTPDGPGTTVYLTSTDPQTITFPVNTTIHGAVPTFQGDTFFTVMRVNDAVHVVFPGDSVDAPFYVNRDDIGALLRGEITTPYGVDVVDKSQLVPAFTLVRDSQDVSMGLTYKLTNGEVRTNFDYFNDPSEDDPTSGGYMYVSTSIDSTGYEKSAFIFDMADIPEDGGGFVIEYRGESDDDVNVMRKVFSKVHDFMWALNREFVYQVFVNATTQQLVIRYKKDHAVYKVANAVTQTYNGDDGSITKTTNFAIRLNTIISTVFGDAYVSPGMNPRLPGSLIVPPSDEVWNTLYEPGRLKLYTLTKEQMTEKYPISADSTWIVE